MEPHWLSGSDYWSGFGADSAVMRADCRTEASVWLVAIAMLRAALVGLATGERPLGKVGKEQVQSNELFTLRMFSGPSENAVNFRDVTRKPNSCRGWN
jgi:hypothetical protein